MDFPLDLQDRGGPDPEQQLIAAQESEQRMADRLQLFEGKLASRRKEWIGARASAGHDRRWSEDLDQYNGKDSQARQASQMMTSVEQGYPVTSQGGAKPSRSTVYVQVTRQKTNSFCARVADIVLPTDDLNFGVQPTPIPGMPAFVQPPVAAPTAGGGSGSLAGQMPSGAGQDSPPAGAPPIGGPQPAAATPGAGGPQVPGQGAAPQPGPQAPAAASGPAIQGQPLSPAAQRLIDAQAEAHKRAQAMQLKIEDAYDECDYNAEARKAIFDMGLFGVGVMKGPIVINRTRKVWSERTDSTGAKTWTLEVQNALDPASYRIDPRNFYPDPACGENVQNGRGAYEVNKLTPKQVRDLAKQPAYIKAQLRKVIEEGPQAGKALSAVADLEDRDVTGDEVFEHWVYWGEVDREDLIAAGVEVSDDDLEVTSACIEMINSTVVRAYLNPLEACDNALPYDMVPCERIPGSVYGYGVPYLMRSQQRVINAAWRMILDNAGVSSGPQIVVNPQVIQPADKQWTIAARKIWYANGDVDDVKKAFATFEFNSHQQELSAIIDMADRLSDQETAVPMLTSGQQQKAGPDTVGGMQMLMNSANVMLRRLVKQFDDYLTKPHVRRYYDFFMEYSEDEDIKGDFQVVATGSSHLVVKDIQNQAFTNMLALGSNPAYAPLINLKQLFTQALKAQHIDPLDVMNTDAQIQAAQQAAAQNQQPDPRVQASQIRAEADKERTQAQVQMNEATVQAKLQAAQEQTSIRMQELQMEKDIAMLQVSAKQGISVDNIKAQLAAVAIRERSKQDLHAKDSASAQAQPALDMQHQVQQHVLDTTMQGEQHQAQAARDAQSHQQQLEQAEQAHRVALAQQADKLNQSQQTSQAALDQQAERHRQEMAQAASRHSAEMRRAAAAARTAAKAAPTTQKEQ